MNRLFVYLVTYLVTAVATVGLDFVWIGWLMNPFYQRELGHLLRLQDGRMAPSLPAAAVVYVLIPLGLLLFVWPRVQQAQSPGTLAALGWGAVYGLVLYGVYEATSYSILENWPLRMALVDTAWGCVLCACGAAVMQWMGKLLEG